MTDILGYLTQCDCGQQAFTAAPAGKGWRCPPCSSGFGDVDIDQGEPDWPIGSVQL